LTLVLVSTPMLALTPGLSLIDAGAGIDTTFADLPGEICEVTFMAVVLDGVDETVGEAGGVELE
jgi:hypothetical protein